MIAYLADPTEDEFLLASPYFIPEKSSLDELRALNEDGVDVKILTNSLASTNHTLVNSHYKKYRRPILDAGAELYEFRHQPSLGLRAEADVEPVSAPFISLHAKVIVLDRRKCFIGSLNFDPRALVINSENGMLIDSPEFSSVLAAFLEEIMEPENAYRLVLTNNNKIEWRADDKILTGQPSRGLLQSLGDFFGAFLPIEDQL
jgi:putative cardiolipin synthase